MAHLAGVECKNSLCGVCRKSEPMVPAGTTMTMHGVTYRHDGTIGWERVDGGGQRSMTTAGPAPDVDWLLARSRADGTLARGAMSMRGSTRRSPETAAIRADAAACAPSVLSARALDRWQTRAGGITCWPRSRIRRLAAHDAEIDRLLTKVRNSFSVVVEV
jgi:hypothetical protein